MKSIVANVAKLTKRGFIYAVRKHRNPRPIPLRAGSDTYRTRAPIASDEAAGTLGR